MTNARAGIAGALGVLVLFTTLGVGTQPNFFTQLKSTPYFDPRTYGARGNGTTNDTAAIQSAMDAVPVSVHFGFISGTTPSTVQLPAGTFLICATLKWKRMGLILRGSGPSNIDAYGVSPGTVLLAGSAAQCGSTFSGPVIMMDPQDVFLSTGNTSQVMVSSAVQNLTIDTTNAAGSFTSPAIVVRSTTNPPIFNDIRVRGGQAGCFKSEIALAAGARVSSYAENNGIILDNFHCAPLLTPTAPGVWLTGCLECAVRGGRVIASTMMSPAGNTSDIAAIQIESADYDNAGSDINLIGTYSANYDIGVRIKGIDHLHNSTGASITPDHYGPQGIILTGHIFEAWNRALVVRDEGNPNGYPNSPSINVTAGINNRWFFSCANSACSGGGVTPKGIDADWVSGGNLSMDSLASVSYGGVFFGGTMNNVVNFTGYDLATNRFTTTNISGAGFNRLIPQIQGGAFASLPTGVSAGMDGVEWWCNNCNCNTVGYGATPTAGGGTGSQLHYSAVASAWVCK